MEVLSKDIHLARIDLYEVDKKLYFGEITFFPDSGFDNRILESTDILFGEKLQLPNEKIKGE